MLPILIGSRALAHWVTNYSLRSDTDWDIVSDTPVHINNTEVHDPEILFNRELERYVESTITVDGIELGVVSLKGLAIVKRSHLWRNLGFSKHITQYHRHLAASTALFTDADKRLLMDRTIETKKLFPQGHPSLNKTKEEFFDDYVTKKYDHDYIHTLVCYESEPIYVKMLRHNETVMCCEDKWNALSFSQKCMAVSEETMVIALERFIIPNDWKYPAKKAYFLALEKVCTTLCSGWFRDFAIDNYPLIVDMFSENRMMGIRYKLEGV